MKAHESSESGVGDRRYEAYRDERKLLVQARSEQSRAFDKTLTTLAAGAFAFSLAYIQLLSPQAGSIANIQLLLSSWGCLGFSLFVTLLSFLASQRACSRQIEIVEAYMLDADNSAAGRLPRNAWSSFTCALNLISLASFVTGILTLSLFAISNLPN